MKSPTERDQAVLEALDENIKLAPQFGICSEQFYVLKQEFLRIIQERDDALRKLSEVSHNGQ